MLEAIIILRKKKNVDNQGNFFQMFFLFFIHTVSSRVERMDISFQE